MLKNESAQNVTKPMPLRPSRLPDSGGIFTSSNGLRMRKLSHLEVLHKQEKSQLVKGHVAHSGGDTWQVA
jgi:hypothetical protein